MTADLIQQPYTLSELRAKIASHEYSAELLLQHAMLLLDRQAPAEAHGLTNDVIADIYKSSMGQTLLDRHRGEVIRFARALFAKADVQPKGTEPAAYISASGEPHLTEVGRGLPWGTPLYTAAPSPAPAPATAGLRKAAQDVLDRWNSPKWEWAKQGPTADLMAKLREELEASPAPAVVDGKS